MFGISKREIEGRIAHKIIEELKQTGHVHLAGVGRLTWTSGSDTVRFQQDPELLASLKGEDLSDPYVVAKKVVDGL